MLEEVNNMKKILKKKVKNSANAIRYFSGENPVSTPRGTHPDYGQLTCTVGCAI
jgi:hypothetical protein